MNPKGRKKNSPVAKLWSSLVNLWWEIHQLPSVASPVAHLFNINPNISRASEPTFRFTAPLLHRSGVGSLDIPHRFDGWVVSGGWDDNVVLLNKNCAPPPCYN